MTHYDEFGLSPSATLEEIQRAHRHLARLLHPDPIQDEHARRLAESQLKRLNGIYSVLSDPVQRRSYDQRLMRPATPVHHQLALYEPPRSYRPPRCGPAARWQVSWGAVAIALLAGFQLAAWWRQPEAPAADRVVYIDRAPPAAAAAAGAGTVEAAAPPSLVASSFSTAADLRQMAAEIRDLKRLLNQAAHERDQALARLAASPRFTPAAPPSVGSAMAASPAASPSAAALPGSAAAVVAGATTNPEPARARPSTLAGTWIYSAPSARISDSGQYSAEYIELQLGEREGLVWGRYRARYKVSDRALSPDVEFYFEGPVAGTRPYIWRGTAGAKGELRLKLLSDNVLSLDWFTSQLGRNPMLGSGTAVLVRRHQE
jgi:hypothetical protein